MASENAEAVSDGTFQGYGNNALAEGLIELVKPAVEEIDERVRAVRQSQVELRQHIDAVSEELKLIAELQDLPVDLESYVKRLSNARRRVMLVNNILQNAQERLNKLQAAAAKDIAKKKSQLDPTE